MASFAYTAINAEGLELDGEINAPDLSAAREALRVRGLLALDLDEQASSTRGPARRRQEGQAEDPPDLLAPVRDDDRGGPERRHRARHPRGADRGPEVRRGDRRGARRRRGRAHALRGARAPPEDLLAPLRLDGRGRRGGRNPRRRARPRRLPDREGDADQAPREGRDDVPADGPGVRDARPDRHAPLPRPDLRGHLQAARRRPADADEARRRGVGAPEDLLVHHLPGRSRPDLRAPAPEEDRARDAASGTGSG